MASITMDTANLGFAGCWVQAFRTSAVTPDRMPFETKPPTRDPVNGSRDCRREAEFRSALDSYMADYRKRRVERTANRGSAARNTHFTFFSRFAGWISASGRDFARAALVPAVEIAGALLIIATAYYGGSLR